MTSVSHRILQKPNTSDVELKEAAQKYHIPLVFIGFRDELKKKEPQAGAYIINIQASDNGFGTHWVGMYLARTTVPSKNAFYYDSMGAAPVEEALSIMQRWTKNNSHIYINPYNIQDVESGFCGAYVIDFLKSIMRNPTREGYINFLNKYKLNLRIQKNIDTNI